jgi:hypothetical protein
MKVALNAIINLKSSLLEDEFTDNKVQDLAYDKGLRCFRFVYRETIYWVPREEVTYIRETNG